MAKKKAKKASKKTSKKSAKKPAKKSKGRAKKARRPAKVKETVRVKTFIVEKPVYVEAPKKNPRHPESFEVFDSGKSRYAKEEPEEDYNEPYEGEGADFEESIAEGEGALEETEPADAELHRGHPRSRGMFSKVWWKRAAIQGFAVWLVILVFAFFMDFLNLSTLELQRNWVYLLFVILVLMLAYQWYVRGRKQ